MRALIQKKDGQFATINGWAAWFGLDKKGYDISFFEWPDLRDGKLEIDRPTLVVGGVRAVLTALERIGAKPETIDYPESLTKYLGRKIQPSTMADVRAAFAADPGPPMFVKPREIHKAFSGYVFSVFRDLIPTAAQPDELAVWISETVDLVSEWRYFVRKKEIIGVGHYAGNIFIHPDESVVRAAVGDYQPSPVAYGIDFGVTADGRTVLVEVNDAYSLGHIGLRPVPYANMLEDRWAELTG